MSGVEDGLGLGLGLNLSEGFEGCWNGRVGGVDGRFGDFKGLGGSFLVRLYICFLWYY